jgi:vacuolar-type H+-ATPase subunit H
MKLSEVFSLLLSAEEQAVENVRAAKNEVEKLRRKSREGFEGARKAAISDAHVRARSLVEESRQRGEKEALSILKVGETGRMKIIELFENNVDTIMTSLANEVAAKYSARARNGERGGSTV